MKNRGANPTVSVLTCCYNSARWVSEAIESVLSQTYENFEFILIDDGSTDETWQIIQRYSGRDRRIVAVPKRHSGLADSLNIGMALATGTWIARLDSDDLCEKNRLEKQIEFVNRHPNIVLLGSGVIEMDERGQTIREHQYPPTHKLLVQHLQRLQRFFPHSSALFSRARICQVGGYNERFKKSQDWDLWLRVAEHGRIACLRASLVRVRKHATQISSSNSGLSQLVYGAAASTCHFLRKAGVADPSAEENEKHWIEFLAWIERRMNDNAVLSKHLVWTEARKKYFAEHRRLIGVVKLGIHLLGSGYVTEVLYERIWGNHLPRRLATQWVERSCAAS